MEEDEGICFSWCGGCQTGRHSSSKTWLWGSSPKVNLSMICTTDIKILNSTFPVPPGIVIGHELVGEIKELGHGIEGFEVGERVVVCADSPCGQCNDE